MTKRMKKSTADLVRAILFALCALTWIPNWPVERMGWLWIALLIVCAAVSIVSLSQYFEHRKMERAEK